MSTQEQQQFDAALTSCVAAEIALRRLLAEPKPAEQAPEQASLAIAPRADGAVARLDIRF